MDVNGNSGWRAGGTRTPHLVKRGGPAARIRHLRAADVVPLRATGRVSWDVNSPVERLSRSVTRQSRVLSRRTSVGVNTTLLIA